MKAIILERPSPIENSPLKAAELPIPTPAPGELLVRVHCCAICRTDLHVIEGELGPGKYPIIPGHQIVGRVAGLGAGGSRFGLGERVGIAWLRHTCGSCAFCQAGRENLCESARFTGYQEHGGFAEYALVPEAFAYAIPECFSDVEAAPLLCAGIIGYRALERAALPTGGKLGLFGFGSSAHVVIQIAIARGSKVYVVTRGEKHRALARSMGAAWVGEASSDLPIKLDSAILFAPAGELVPAALDALTKGGTLALAGIHLSQIPPLDYRRHLFFEKNVRSVTANTREDGRALLAEAARIGLRPHVTSFALSAANPALRELQEDRIGGTGVLIVLG